MPDPHPEWLADHTRTPRGVRNMNPGNIRDTSLYQWRGQDGKDADGFCKFIGPQWGLRAIFIVLHTYVEHDGCDTLGEIIRRWAPPEENNSQAYMAWVGHALDLDPASTISLAAHSLDLVRAIVRYENGCEPYELKLYETARDLASEH